MSTNYDVRCLDCDEEHWASRDISPPKRPGIVEGLVKIAPQLAALAEAIVGTDGELYDAEFMVCYHSVDLDWFLKHKGHRLICADGYGRWRQGR